MRPLRRVTATTTALGMAAAGLIIAVSGTAHASACSQSNLPLPDSSCTPGSYNPNVTQSNIHSTICVSGWTDTVRPPTSYTNPLKAQGIIDYGYSDTNMSDYEEDHLVPLELGGAPRDPGNLWPEPHYGAKTAPTLLAAVSALTSSSPPPLRNTTRKPGTAPYPSHSPRADHG
ncbi:hypothetical protein ABZW44_45395 [Streptomyces mirabilis]|uniref:hypothetical protein n=1 Tax=Streptomyces mirabilis TaxID=68239 RepID=UPI0033B3105D